MNDVDTTAKAKKDERIAKTHQLIERMNNGAGDVFSLIAEHSLHESRERVVEDCVRLGNMQTQTTLAANLVAAHTDQVNRKVALKDCFEHCVQARNDAPMAAFWLEQLLEQYKDKRLADKGVTNAVNACVCTGKTHVLHAVLEKALPVVGRQFLKQVWTQARSVAVVEYAHSPRFVQLTRAEERDEGAKLMRKTLADSVLGHGQTADKKTFNALVSHQDSAGKAELAALLWNGLLKRIQYTHYHTAFTCPEYVLGYCVRNGQGEHWEKTVALIADRLHVNSTFFNASATIACELIGRLEKHPTLFERFAGVLHKGFDAAVKGAVPSLVQPDLKNVLAFVHSLDAKIQKIVLLHAVEHTLSDVANPTKSRKM